MKKIILPALLLISWMILLSIDIPVGENFFPSAGRFFNPVQGVWQNVEGKSVTAAFTADVKQEIKILFDERDVPHIYAENPEDAIYAQGYLHAAHRLFSMDISTRAAAGRLSEILGSRTLSYDHNQRQRGFAKAAAEKAANWFEYEGNEAILRAYVQGINDYISSLDYSSWPIEYKILSKGPPQWTVEHVALMATNMAIMLCLAEHDLDYSKALSSLAPTDFLFLFPERNPLESPIIPQEHKWDFKAMMSNHSSSNLLKDTLHQEPQSKKTDINGSNNWAVAGSKTKNGHPILANDPHLGLTLPSIWYEMEIHTPEMHVHGASIPGLPFIIIGFNESIAWGTTNSGQDVLDWYSVTWSDSSKTKYLLDGEYHNAIMHPEEIRVRGRASVIDTIRYTHWGPVMNEGKHTGLAMKWIGHLQANTNDLAYLQQINKASNVTAYRKAVEAFLYPAQNKVFASVEGDIAITVAGIMPVRPQDSGNAIQDGTSTENDWSGFIPFAHAPFDINPEREFVSSANQVPAGATYPYPLLGFRTFEDYRGRVINQVLDTSTMVDVQAMMRLQQNNFNQMASDVLPYLMQTIDSSGCTNGAKQYSDVLHQWNFEQHKDSIAPVLFDIWYDLLESMFFDELDSLGIMHPEDWRTIELIKGNDHHPYFDLVATPDIESKEDIICLSFLEMIKTYEALEDPAKKNWGHYKASQIPHIARFPSLGIPFISTSGGRHIVNAQSATHGPSWRMIVELSQPPVAYINYPGGQSGNPASIHYMDFVDDFFNGKYYEVRLRKEADNWTPAHQITIHAHEAQ